MGFWYLWAIAAAVVIYLVLQGVDDERNRRQGRPVAGTGQRVMLGFLVVVVCLVIFYMLMGMATAHTPLIGGSAAASANGALAATGGDAWYKSINEDIRVGLPGF